MKPDMKQPKAPGGSLPRRVRPSDARRLYLLALECRREAVGGTTTDPKWADASPTYQRTWLLLARRLASMGWRPNSK